MGKVDRVLTCAGHQQRMGSPTYCLAETTTVKMMDTPDRIMGGDVAQLVEHRTGTSPTQVRFPDAARVFSPRVNFQCRLSYGVRAPPCAIACYYICAHVTDPVVHVRVR